MCRCVPFVLNILDIASSKNTGSVTAHSQYVKDAQSYFKSHQIERPKHRLNSTSTSGDDTEQVKFAEQSSVKSRFRQIDETQKFSLFVDNNWLIRWVNLHYISLHVQYM